MKAPEIEPAPKRGQYDRALSRRDRQAAQRERVIAAIAALSAAGRELNVANVVELAGIGRNTFYEYFDDIEHALVAIKSRAVHELATSFNAALQVARTPLERVRALARAWVENMARDPVLMRLALQAQAELLEPTQLSALARHLATVLDAEREARSALPGLADPRRVLAVVAAFDSVSRAQASLGAIPDEDLKRLLADLSLRMLR